MRKKVIGSIKYAFQEIVLVVIGILIAVSINNWNEQRNQKEELASICQTIVADIRNDIDEIDMVLAHYIKEDTLFKNVLNASVTKEDYKTDQDLRYLMLGFPEISYNKRGINLLEKFKGNRNILNEQLVQDIIDFYTERMWEIKVDEDLRSEDFKENFTYWKKNTTWWADFISITEEGNTQFIEYALTSQDYRNRVATNYFLTYKVYLPELEEFKKLGLELITKIEHKYK